MPRFEPGQSGNPRGKIRGTKNKLTLALEDRANEYGDVLSKKLYQLAAKGNVQAIRLVYENTVPKPKEAPILFPLPKPTTSLEIPGATAAVLVGATTGELTLSDAQKLMGLIKCHEESIDRNVLVARMNELEARMAERTDEPEDA